MGSLTRSKLEQAKQLVNDSHLGCWLIFVRETCGGTDPSLPLLLDGGLTWQSALIITPAASVAVVGNYDADPLTASGDWDFVIPYVEDFAPTLRQALADHVHGRTQVGVNYSLSDSKADGITHGMYLALEQALMGTDFSGFIVSAEDIARRLRSRKSAEEQARISAAIAEGDLLFAEIEAMLPGRPTEKAIQEAIHQSIDSKGLGYGWAKEGNPIVNSGPDSMVGHGVPSADIQVTPGHVFHVDLGVIKDDYSSDIQRCWYISEGEPLPDDVKSAAEAVNAAITKAAELLKPDVRGCDIDQAAREVVKSYGYPEYMHALGHQVGRLAHDGGAIIGPEWPRYGSTPVLPIEEDEVYTLELGVMVEGRGYLGLEEIVVVTDDGCRFLSERQIEIPVINVS